MGRRCHQKRRFASPEEALAFADEHRLHRPVWTYWCRYCLNFHLTRQAPDPKRRSRGASREGNGEVPGL